MCTFATQTTLLERAWAHLIIVSICELKDRTEIGNPVTLWVGKGALLLTELCALVK